MSCGSTSLPIASNMRRRDWRRLMEREGVNVVIPQPATPEQTAWLRATRIPVRSIEFDWDETLAHDAALKLEASTFTTSTDLLVPSTRSLEVCAAAPPDSLNGNHAAENVLQPGAVRNAWLQ